MRKRLPGRSRTTTAATVLAVGVAVASLLVMPGRGQTPAGYRAPRTADGKPDLSGVWQVRQGSYLVYVTSDLKPEEILPWAAAAYKKSADTFRRDSDGIKCLPPGPKAGISGLTFNDLRGTAVTRLALVGCTEAQIASITGHSLRDVHSILDAHYLHRDPALAESAITKLEMGYATRTAM